MINLRENSERTEPGALTEAVYYILLSLLAPRHGYAVMQNVERLTDGRVTLGAGTLYGALNTLLEKAWIMSLAGERDSRKKEYGITELGKSVLQRELRRLEELVAHGKDELEGLEQ
ncbi:MAG: PadR family transcriptional regulator [Oscillospiraceae bacterium]|jgi:DNA-binding PadR family transcriptional regulator|nr:PadR family transcriptional regulator [Oscillospiraceae bacterium]